MSYLSERIGDAFNLNNYFGTFSDFGTGGASGDFGSYATIAGIYGSRPIDLQNLQFQQYDAPTAYAAQDIYDPETLSDTELAEVLTNPRLADLYGVQTNVLGGLGEYSKAGMSAIDNARLAEIQNQINMQNKGNQEAILQNMAQRGLAGSGSELAARLNAQQGAAQSGYLAGSQLAGDAAQRAFQALQSQGAYAGQMTNQQYQQLANEAQAQDMINRYNTEMGNQALIQDYQTKQRIGEMNTEQTNRVNQSNKDLINQAIQYNTVQKPMNQYAMQSNQAQMAMQGLGNQANIAAQNAAANQQFWGNLAGSAIQGGAYWAGQKKT
jgi:hypothetical protein